MNTHPARIPAAARRVLRFGFGRLFGRVPAQYRRRWFRKSAAFDAAIQRQFAVLHDAARTGQLRHWEREPHACLALCVVLDQFSRNMFRDDPRAFASDESARAVARQAIARGFDLAVQEQRRVFFYLPFEHSEDLADQALCLALTRPLRREFHHGSAWRYAQRHYAVIQRFGRFPHRNVTLGRDSTAAEQEFLRHRGSRF
jgi:uncharacterized protein (DUF924 family)